MINILEKSDCCGCSACIQICPKQCISMHSDEQGFSYPTVDLNTCIECGLCEKVCPVINQETSRLPIAVYAAKNKDEKVRLCSASGGIFTPLATKTINNGGVVFGAKFAPDFSVVHSYTETLEGLSEFRGSKYVQSDINNSYINAQAFLKEGKEVLFTGTPCQIAGLKHFLRKEYDNLITVDVVCHGVPSPKIWKEYLNSVADTTNITSISFRDKCNGWKRFHFSIKGVNGSDILRNEASNDIYLRGFIRNLYLRPSCFSCPAKSGKSQSDITIADFWGIDKYYPKFDDDKGTGLVLVNSTKGERIFKALDIDYISATYEQAISNNPAITKSMRIPRIYNRFWDWYGKQGISAIELALKKLKPSIIQLMIISLKYRIHKYLHI